MLIPNRKGTTLWLSWLALVTIFSLSQMSFASGYALDGSGKRRICVLSEPNPITYMSGHSARFRLLLQHFADHRDDTDQLQMVTADAVTPNPPTHCYQGKIPIHYAVAFRLPFYRALSLSFDITLKVFRVLFPFPKSKRFDLIHCSSPGTLLFSAILASRIYQIPLLMSYHTHIPIYARSYLPSPLNKWIEVLIWKWLKFMHSFADLTLVTSPQIAEEFARQGIPAKVWLKGVDTNKFNPKHRNVEMRNLMSDGHPEDCLLVYIGRLGKEKRLNEIRDMIEVMNSNGVPTRLCIAGGGPEEKELKKYFHGTPTVFTGMLHGKELSQAFASGDVFVMPSDSETLGFVVLESMASGVPVVAARAGGLIDLIDHGVTGYLASTGDKTDFLRSIELLQRNPEVYRNVSLACRRETERWSWESSMTQISEEAYPQAIENFSQRWEQRLYRWLRLKKEKIRRSLVMP